MTKIKICGITRIEDALAAVKAGADALGFVFYKKSPRFISPAKARRIIEALPPFVSKVGVFVNEKSGVLRDIAAYCALDAIQLHGDEDHHMCHRFKRYGLKIIKAFRVKEDFNLAAVPAYRVDAYLFDAYSKDSYGGSGESFDRGIVMGLNTEVPVILSGGLTADNVQDAIRLVRPYAVDVSSGVEVSPGIKDPTKVSRFIQIVRSVV